MGDAPTASGSRQLRSTRGKLESDPQGNDEAALPSVQGAGSVSYGAPGMADLPDMLFHNPNQTLAETIDAGLQDSKARANALVKDFQREFTKSPSPESHVSQEASSNGSTTSGRTAASRSLNDVMARNGPLPPLFEDDELDEQEDDEQDEQEQEELDERDTGLGLPMNSIGGARPSSSSGNATVSFIQERATHATTVPVSTMRARERRQSANLRPGNRYSVRNVLLFPLLLVALLFLVGATLGMKRAALACRRVPFLAQVCSDFAFHTNPFLSIKDRRVAQRTLDHYTLVGANLESVGAKLDTIEKGWQQQQQLNVHVSTTLKELFNHVFGMSSLLGHLNRTNISPGEWYYDQINHFDPGNGAVFLPDVTSTTFTILTSPWQSFVNWWLGRHRPLSPGAALSGWARAGDCWCANIVERNRGWAQLGVRVLKEIWPTSLVLDHLPKTASLNPSATPKNVELWAYVPSEKGRSILLDMEPFTSLNAGHDTFFPAEWVRIKNATYNINDFHVQFFDIPYPRFNETAAKDFAVRATSNYGKEQHTCFYSVILRGEVVFPEEVGVVDVGL